MSVYVRHAWEPVPVSVRHAWEPVSVLIRQRHFSSANNAKSCVCLFVAGGEVPPKYTMSFIK